MVIQTVKYRYCQSENLRKAGWQSGNQRLKYKAWGKTFQMGYTYEAHKPGIKEKIERMAHNGNGIRDTARMLHMNKEYGDQLSGRRPLKKKRSK